MEKRNNLIYLVFPLIMFGCSPTVKVEAPEKPIVIDLNINIEHKVKVQIDKELDTLMKQDNGLF